MKLQIYSLIAGLLILHTVAFSQQKVSLLFMGDVMGHDGQLAAAYNSQKQTYEFDTCFSYIAPIIRSYDIAIANLEVTLNCTPYKGYPSFSSPASLAAAMVHAGVTNFVTANNHSADRGKKGVINTLDALDSIGVISTGTFRNSEERSLLYPLILEKNGIRIAVLNCTYGLNGLPVPEGTVINLIDTTQIKQDIARAKSVNAECIIMCIHWGLEYQLSPNAQQISIANFLKKQGVHAVIGSHPHVVQRAEWDTTNNFFQVFSLGNFISNQRTQPRDGGMMIALDIEKKNDTVTITNAGYILTWVYTPSVNTKKQFYVLPVSQYEQNPDFFDSPVSFSTMNNCMNIIRPVLEKENIATPEIRFETTTK